MTLFKMPPFFDFRSDEIEKTGMDFLEAGILKPPFDSCVFEFTYDEHTHD